MKQHLFLLILCLVPVWLYLRWMILMRRNFNTVHHRPKQHKTAIRLSLLVCYRNESDSLDALLNSIKIQKNAPEVELNFADNNSHDEGPKKINDFANSNGKFKVYSHNITDDLSSAKKQAIDSIVELTDCDWLIVTDADCCFNENYLSSWNNVLEQANHSVVFGMVHANVEASTNKSLAYFTEIEQSMLTAICITGIMMNTPLIGSGANMAINIKEYKRLKPYYKNFHISSGDDMFLLEKAANFGSIGANHHVDSLVKTKCPESFSAAIQQRIRWAAKQKHIRIRGLKLFGLLPLLCGFVIYALLIAGIVYSSALLFVSGVTALMLKIVVEIQLYNKVSLQKNKRFMFLLMSGLFYPLFQLLIIVLSLIMKPQWKGKTSNT
jgi:poly-beta-1,6-N-acetyl-D-glucosamine synthase